MQRLALDELHHEVGHAAVEDAVVGDADGVRVADGGRGHRLLAEARDERGVVADEVGEDDLDGVLRLDEDVAGLEDHAHAALAELALELVALVKHGVEGDEKIQALTVARTVIQLIGEAAMTGRALFHSDLRTNPSGADARRTRPEKGDHSIGGARKILTTRRK